MIGASIHGSPYARRTDKLVMKWGKTIRRYHLIQNSSKVTIIYLLEPFEFSKIEARSQGKLNCGGAKVAF